MSSIEVKDKGRTVQDNTKPAWSRRNFLKASLATTGALALSPLSRKAVQAQSSDGTVQEEWYEPWEWRVSEYGPDDYLQLNVVEHQAPGLITGDTGTPLFSYNGMVPGPTIRMGGDEIMRLHVVNQLSGNNGNYAYSQGSRYVKSNENVPKIPDWQIASMAYGPHQQHTTNIHTHGLHVSPRPNPDGSNSDNVFLRIIPEQDFQNRRRTRINWPLKYDGQHREIKKEAKYEFRLGKSSGPDVETHPPGTHWYHPHPHGATYDQVASGMAGFLIVEGDVDASLKQQIKGYKERLILFQRVSAPPPAEAEEPTSVAGTQVKTSFPTVNGRTAGELVMVMQPGAIERWRVLNGSVDGQGYSEFAVTKGTPEPVAELPANPTTAQRTQFNTERDAQTREIIDNEQMLDQLAFDGITLVNPNGAYDTMRVKSLVLAPANRADFLFQAPQLASGQTSEIYTIWAKYVSDAVDGAPGPQLNIKLATLVVQGDPVDPGVTRNPQTGKLNLKFPQVPGLIKPISDNELRITTGADAGKWRTRQVIYAGWGNASYGKLCTKPEAPPGGKIDWNSMTIDSVNFDSDMVVHKMALGSPEKHTAEEWTVSNYSMTIFTDENGTVRYGETVPQSTFLQSGVTLNTKATDHPFHIHQNPVRVHSIKDANGNELLPKDQNGKVWPRWQDVVRIPRNGGRAVFRSRFWDYVGDFVNHCHLLQHEDWGMMQQIGVVVNEKDANYVPKPAGYKYPPPTKLEMYNRCLIFKTPPPASKKIQYCEDPNPGPPTG